MLHLNKACVNNPFDNKFGVFGQILFHMEFSPGLFYTNRTSNINRILNTVPITITLTATLNLT